MLTDEDLCVISILWLVLISLNFRIEDPDLSEPGYIQRSGSHNIYTFSVFLENEDDFPEQEFRAILKTYRKITPVKPHFYNIEKYPCKNGFRAYISVYI